MKKLTQEDKFFILRLISIISFFILIFVLSFSLSSCSTRNTVEDKKQIYQVDIFDEKSSLPKESYIKEINENV